MNLEYLRTFRRLHEVGNFGEVARQLGISQPAVTYRIDKLEAELGVRLVEEPRRGVTLTREGREVLAFSDALLPSYDRLRQSLAHGPPPEEPLRVVAPGSIGRTLLFPILCGPAFHDVPLTLLFRGADDIFELVSQGECDVGLNYRMRTSHVLDVEEVCREEFVLITPGSEPAIEVADAGAFDDLPFLTYEECDYVFGCWFEAVLRRRPERVISAHHFARLDEVIRMVALARGVSIVPLPACRAAVASGEVRVVSTPRRCLNSNYLIARSGWNRTPAFASLRSALLSVEV